MQNKAYFEVKIQAMGKKNFRQFTTTEKWFKFILKKKTGNWGVGLAQRRVDLNKTPLGNDTDSWVLRSDGSIYHNAIKVFEIGHKFEDSDVLVR